MRYFIAKVTGDAAFLKFNSSTRIFKKLDHYLAIFINAFIIFSSQKNLPSWEDHFQNLLLWGGGEEQIGLIFLNENDYIIFIPIA